MNARAWRIGALSLLVASVVAFVGWGQGAPVYPQGLIIDPPTSQELEASISTDKPSYLEGELVTISYEVNKTAYIYIWDILPTGEVQVVFPSASYPGGMDNFVQAGAHEVPRNFPAARPFGTEYLQILATTTPIDIAAFPMSDPGLFQQQVEVQVLGLLLEDERTWSFTSFEIVEQAAPPPDYATLIITSTPSGASITIDGTDVGLTPGTHYVPQGLHTISISKAGYATHRELRIIYGTRAIEISPVLTPLFPTNNSPTASFAYAPPNPVVGSYVQFNASASFDSDGSIVSYRWNFGDGTTGSGPVTSNWFTSAGTFSVTLTVTDDDGATNSTTRTVQVGPINVAPVASFTATQFTGGWVQFDASGSFDSDGSIVSYQWSFGDGNYGSGPIVPNQYLPAGSFLVTLTVVDDDGASATATQVIVIASSNVAPTAAFTYTPIFGKWIRFDATASSDADGSIVSYQWSFGDGTSADTGTVAYAYHEFPTAGTYLATLTVTDDGGATDSTSQVVDLGPAQQPPVAVITHSPLFPQIGDTITLNGSSSSDPDGSIISYLWDRNGDGLTDASGPVVQVSYASPAAVTVRLDVTDNDGLTSSSTQVIVVSPSSGPAGAPLMGTTPGIFVWGTDSWHVTVNAGAGWIVPHSYRLELRTDGTFRNVNEPSDGGVIPLGLILEPPTDSWTLTFEGSISSGSIDYTFQVPDSNSVWMSLKLDLDGDGVLDESSSFVYLRHSLVRPPWIPMVVGFPRGSGEELLPTADFHIGTSSSYTESRKWVFYGTTISQLESR